MITYAPTRDAAVDRMDRALSEFVVAGRGVRTTIPFLRRVLAHPSFRRGGHCTSLITEMSREDEP